MYSLGFWVSFCLSFPLLSPHPQTPLILFSQASEFSYLCIYKSAVFVIHKQQVGKRCFSMLKERNTRQKPELSMHPNNPQSKLKSPLLIPKFQMKTIKRLNCQRIKMSRNPGNQISLNLTLHILSLKQKVAKVRRENLTVPSKRLEAIPANQAMGK